MPTLPEVNAFLAKRSKERAPFSWCPSIFGWHYGILFECKEGYYFEDLEPHQRVIFHNALPKAEGDSNIGYVIEDNERWVREREIDINTLKRRADRAGRILSQKEYDLLGFNCEHLARYLATGEYSSRQIEEKVKAVGTGVMMGVCASIGAFVGIVAAAMLDELIADEKNADDKNLV